MLLGSDHADSVPTMKRESTATTGPLSPAYHLSELYYMPAPLLGTQPLLFITLSVVDQPLKALVDSGATRTFVGPGGHRELKRLGFQTIRKQGQVQVANGNMEVVSEEIEFPVELNGTTGLIRARVLNSLPVAVALGLDFLTLFKMSVDFEDRSWVFKDDPSRVYYFALEESNAESCCGISELTLSQAELLKNFIAVMLPKAPEKPGITNLTEHFIDTGIHPPIKQRHYLVSPNIMEVINQEVDKMLADDIIEPSSSGWSSPIVLVRKPDGSRRFCLDFRKLNQVTKKDAYPLPQMNGILDKLRSARYISKIDLFKGFLQIPLEASSKEKTAFTVPGRGLFQFKRMPFGLTNAPATFQRLLDRLIGPEMEPHAFAYLDDIIIVTKTFGEHLKWLAKVLIRIKEAGLEINPDKSKFCCSEVQYLGFVVNESGLQTDPGKVEPILNYPRPRNVKDMRKFLGLTSWYRRFIPDYATIVSPLSQLLKKKQRWVWSCEQQEAFDKVRRCLVEAPILACPDFEVPFMLQTDASNTGLGAVLTQSKDGAERVISYASRTLNDAERRYSTTEKECLAILWAIQKFRAYLEGYHLRSSQTIVAYVGFTTLKIQQVVWQDGLCRSRSMTLRWFIGREPFTTSPMPFQEYMRQRCRNL